MKSRVILSAVAAFSLLAAAVYAEVKLEGVKCVVAGGKAAKADNSVEYKGGKVFFCCQGCPKAFAKDTAKYAVKANQQLVQTGQAKQTGCPISGKGTDPSTAVSVNGTEVAFCCPNCKGKVEKAEGDAKAELVFSDAAFEKAFKVEAK